MYDVVQPYTHRIKAYRGIQFGDGSRFQWQTFGGRVVDTTLTGDGRCTIDGADVAYDVVSNQFTAPRNSDVGVYVTDEVKTIIKSRKADATFGTFDSFNLKVPTLTWESDPGQALDEMATSCGAFWYALANTDFVLRRYPWTVPGQPIVTFSDDNGGTITSSTARKDRTAIYNQIVVTGERVDGSPPVFAVSQDLNPASPTYALGLFGIQSKLVRLQTPTAQSGAQDAADAYLKRTTALTEAWSFTCIPDASLELGDIIGISARGRQGIVQVVASYTIPMTVSGQMSVNCRAQVLGVLEGT
jgi:hypothetical protein